MPRHFSNLLHSFSILELFSWKVTSTTISQREGAQWKFQLPQNKAYKSTCILPFFPWFLPLQWQNVKLSTSTLNPSLPSLYLYYQLCIVVFQFWVIVSYLLNLPCLSNILQYLSSLKIKIKKPLSSLAAFFLSPSLHTQNFHKDCYTYCLHFLIWCPFHNSLRCGFNKMALKKLYCWNLLKQLIKSSSLKHALWFNLYHSLLIYLIPLDFLIFWHVFHLRPWHRFPKFSPGFSLIFFFPLCYSLMLTLPLLFSTLFWLVHLEYPIQFRTICIKKFLVKLRLSHVSYRLLKVIYSFKGVQIIDMWPA